MLYLVVGAGGCGKTTLIRDHILPTLLHRPEDLTPLSPAGGFKVALIDDPPRPQTGAQYPGQGFTDCAEFRRATNRKRVCRFDRARPEELMRLAIECNGAVLVLDEIQRVLGAGPKLKGDAAVIALEGRHYGVATVGCTIGPSLINADAKTNCQGAWIGYLNTPKEQSQAADLIGAPPEILERTNWFKNLKRGEFVYWNREAGKICLTRINNGISVEIT